MTVALASALPATLPLTLTWSIVGIVLFAALLHASWNAAIKASRDKLLDIAMVCLGGSVITLPLVVLAGLPDMASWPWIAASLTIHIGYYIALNGAYRHADLGLTYPVMRGMAPMLVALGSVAAIGEVPRPATWLGVIAISSGVLVLGMPQLRLLVRRLFGHAHPDTAALRGLGFALMNACFIAAYTVVDALGVRNSGDPLAYVLLLFFLDGLPFPLVALLWRGRPALDHVRARWRFGLIGAAFSLGSYGIALWAMTRAPVAVVAALRETSVIFAALLGSFVLKEAFGWNKALGTLIVAAGVVVLRAG